MTATPAYAEPSHLGPFRANDPAYALALPIEQVAVRSDIDAEPAPVYDGLVSESEWARRIGVVSPGVVGRDSRGRFLARR